MDGVGRREWLGGLLCRLAISLSLSFRLSLTPRTGSRTLSQMPQLQEQQGESINQSLIQSANQSQHRDYLPTLHAHDTCPYPSALPHLTPRPGQMLAKVPRSLVPRSVPALFPPQRRMLLPDAAEASV